MPTLYNLFLAKTLIIMFGQLKSKIGLAYQLELILQGVSQWHTIQQPLYPLKVNDNSSKTMIKNMHNLTIKMGMNFSYNMIPTFIIYAWKLQLENSKSSTFVSVAFHHFPTSMKKIHKFLCPNQLNFPTYAGLLYEMPMMQTTFQFNLWQQHFVTWNQGKVVYYFYQCELLLLQC